MRTIKRVFIGLQLLMGLAYGNSACADSSGTNQNMPVDQRMAKARAAKAQKRLTKRDEPTPQKATPQDYAAPVDKVLKGPHGEVVRTGERGAKFYINKNGNKTYLSSNQ